MKFKIHFLFLLLSMFLANCASTQNNQTQSATINNNPELAADKLTAEMLDKLQLSDAQLPKVKAINLNHLEKVQELRQQASGDRSAMQSLKTNLQKDTNAEMKLVLTDSQYQKYLSMQTENTGRRRGSKGSGGRGRSF